VSFVKVKRKLSPDRKAANEFKIFWCPACRQRHKVDKRWTLSGTILRPTLEPEVKLGVITTGTGGADDWDRGLCHFTVKNGVINYAPDCTHALAGKSVPMVDLEEAEEALVIQSSVMDNKSLMGRYGMGVRQKQGLIDFSTRGVQPL
jgi:hypothetical protein